MSHKEQRLHVPGERISQTEILMPGTGIMLHDPRHANAIPIRSSKQVSDRLKVIALLALVLLALFVLVLDKVEIAGDPEYPAAFYSL
jgi:hypothetical protein